jgi:diguanylate cyclase (GGDEF)-like protein
MPSQFARLAAYIGHARARHLLVACGLLIGLVLATTTVLFLTELRREELANAERELHNAALILAEEMDHRLHATELIQLELMEHMRDLGIDTPEEFTRRTTAHDVYEMLREHADRLPDVYAMSLIDVHGQIVNNSRWQTPGIDVTDREFFQVLTADHAPPYFVGEPVQTHADGTWTIMFARRFTTPGGRLLGLIDASIQVAYFEQSFSKIAMQGDSSFVLYRSDGLLLARYPHIDAQIGKMLGDAGNFRRTIAVMPGGVVRQPSMFDGKDRLIAPYALEHYPLLITATNTVAAVLAPWRAEARAFAGVSLLLELVIAGAVLLGVRHLRGYELLQAAETAQAQAEAELAVSHVREQAAQTLAEQQNRFDTALRNMLQGLTMFGDDRRVLVVNQRFHMLFGLSPERIKPGMTYDEVVDVVVHEGNVTAADMQNIRQMRAELVERNERGCITWEMSDGRTLNVTHQPMHDGWLTTYEDISARCATEARMVHLSQYDALTDLPNRVLFHQRLEHAIAFARRGRPLALLFLDLDHFTGVNDTLGHPIGDALLKAVAARLAADTRDIDTVARLGGDEFAIMQTAITRPMEATQLAERLIELLDAPFDIEGHQIVIGTSIGIAFAPQDGLDPDQLLRCADLALYRAKADGRGVCRLFHAEMDAEMQERRVLELDLRQALHANQLEVFYQPFVDVHDKTIVGFEALVRWRHPERGIISPAEFIPLAEEIGLIVPIGEWVLHRACADCASWPGELKVAINLSAVQFGSHNLVAAVASALEASELRPYRLELEVTETVMLQDTETTLATLHEMHRLGARIAMDDFGTGYSSLSYLRRFPFDRIKIDQSFVRDVTTRRDCGAIVRAAVGLSSELGMATTAEGVETEAQLEALFRMGCDEAQGYLFSRPVPAADVPALLHVRPVEIAEASAAAG